MFRPLCFCSYQTLLFSSVLIFSDFRATSLLICSRVCFRHTVRLLDAVVTRMVWRSRRPCTCYSGTVHRFPTSSLHVSSLFYGRFAARSRVLMIDFGVAQFLRIIIKRGSCTQCQYVTYIFMYMYTWIIRNEHK